MEELGLVIPKIHELDHVLTLLLPYHASLRGLRRGLVFLTNFAVIIRYPGENTSKRQAKAALRWAERVRSACHTLLGIRPRRKRSP
jgi:hypothetical protein